MSSYTGRQLVRILKVISERYSREQTVVMTRTEFNTLINTIGRELFT